LFIFLRPVFKFPQFNCQKYTAAALNFVTNVPSSTKPVEKVFFLLLLMLLLLLLLLLFLIDPQQTDLRLCRPSRAYFVQNYFFTPNSTLLLYLNFPKKIILKT